MFPIRCLEKTACSKFRSNHKGENVLIAILDTGVDPAARGLQELPSGEKKIVDLVDCTGAGDVVLGNPVSAVEENGTYSVRGVSGRMLQVKAAWVEASGNKFRLGIKYAKDFFPPKVFERVLAWRSAEFELKHSKLVAKGCGTDTERAEVLKMLSEKSPPDCGPVFDVLTFSDGRWRVVVDTDESGDLTKQRALAEYRFEHEFSRFECTTSDAISDSANLSFSVNMYENVASIVTVSGAHGTHVAAIAAAYCRENSLYDGIAPASQIVSLKIGDSRISGLESGAGLSRALQCILENKVDICNQSFGEPSDLCDCGRFVELLQKHIIKENNIIFVSSAGNSGPALSTLGCPGGTTSGVISVGAHVGADQIAAEYALVGNTDAECVYTWCSRGPAADGDFGITLYAPGSAITSLPICELSCAELMNGTSMSSPYACGCIALLLSALKKQENHHSTARLVKALSNSGIPLQNDPFKLPFIQVEPAFKFLMDNIEHADQDATFKVSVGPLKNRGIYLRSLDCTKSMQTLPVTITPEFPEQRSANNFYNEYYEKECESCKPQTFGLLDLDLKLRIECSHTWIRAPEFLNLTNKSRVFNVQVDAHRLGPGLHVGQVRFKDTLHPEKKTIFCVPVTVCKPSSELEFEIVPSPTVPYRRFVDVPVNASYVDVTVKGRLLQETPPTRVLLHLVQIVPQTPYNMYNSLTSFHINEPMEHSVRCNVVGGVFLEVCVAQFWSSMANNACSCAVSIQFHSFSVSSLACNSMDPVFRFNLISFQLEKNISFSWTIECLRKYLTPTESKISPLSLRDRTPSTKQVCQMVNTFTFKVPGDDIVVFPKVPGIQGYLYSAPYDAYLLMVFDSDKQLMQTNDIYHRESIDLKKGATLTFRLQIRHHDIEMLETLSRACICLDIKQSASLDLYSTLYSALKKKKCEFKTVNGVVPMFIVPNALEIKDVMPGDVVYGKFNISETGKKTFCLSEVSITVNKPKVVISEKSDKVESEIIEKEKNSEKIIEKETRDGKVSVATKLLGSKKNVDRKVIEDYIDALVSEWPEHVPVLMLKLKMLNSSGTPTLELIEGAEPKKQPNFENVVSLCDKILCILKYQELAHDLKIGKKKKLEFRKKRIIKVCLAKSEALLCNVDEFDGTFQSLKAWVDETNFKVMELTVRRCVVEKKYAAALKSVLSFNSSKEEEWTKKIRIWKMALLKKLEFDCWVERETLMNIRKSSCEFAPF